MRVCIAVLAIVVMAGVSHGAVQYLDLNGTTAKFGTTVLDNTVDPTAATWTTDPAGEIATTTFVSGNVAHLDVERAFNVRFNWINTVGLTFAGITTTSSGGGGITRMQKGGAPNETITWTPGAVLDADTCNCSFYNRLYTSSDFTKTGAEFLRFGEYGNKIQGTLTIQEGQVQIDGSGTIGSTSSFTFAGGTFALNGGSGGDYNMGIITGSGSVGKYTGDDMTNLTAVLNGGINLTNSVATNQLSFTWGLSAELAAAATTALDITKASGVTTQDMVKIDLADIPSADASLTLGGNLTVNLLAGSEALAEGDSFDLFDADTITGSFASYTLPDISAQGLGWDTSALGSSGVLTVTLAPLYLGDGSTKPITDTATQPWDLTTSNWLTPNDAGSTYQIWIQGRDVVFVAGTALAKANFVDGISVGDIIREGSGGNVFIYGASGANVITFNDSILSGGGSWYFRTGTYGGHMIMQGITSIQGQLNSQWVAGAKITSDSGGFFNNSFGVTDCTNLTLAFASESSSFKDDAVLGALTGSPSGCNATQINSISPGASTTSTGIGTAFCKGKNGNLILGGGTHSFDIDYTGDVATSDKVDATADSALLTFGGTLDVTLLGGTLVLGASFDLFDAASFAGAFTTINLPALADPKLQWSTSLLATNGTIFVEQAPAKGTVISVQ